MCRFETGRVIYEAFGMRFIGFLGATYFGLKGFNLALMTSLMLPVLQSVGATATTYQLAIVVASTPWSLIGLFGVLSDVFPLGRTHIRGYLLIAAALGLAANLLLVHLAPPSLGLEGDMACWLYAALFFLTNVHFAVFDTLTQGKCAEIMRIKGAGSEAMSFVWTCANLGSLASGICLALLVDTSGTRLLLVMALPFACASFFLAGQGHLPEMQVCKRFSWRLKFWSEPWLFALAVMMGVGALIIAVSAMLLSPVSQLLVTLCVVCFLLAASFRVLPRVLARSNLYMFISAAVYVDISGVLGFFYTAGPQCAPGGPAFSMGYYLACSAICGAGAAAVGSFLFTGIRSWTFRWAFCLTTFVQVAASAFDYALVTRSNVALGIPDRTFYLFGDAICQQLAVMLSVMPGVLLIARLCPRGAEATVYAVLSGFHNLGTTVASVLGVWLTAALGIKSVAPGAGTSGECDFSNLGSAVLIAHCALPLLFLPTILLVPSASIDDATAFAEQVPPPSFASPRSYSYSSPGGPESPLDQSLLFLHIQAECPLTSATSGAFAEQRPIASSVRTARGAVEAQPGQVGNFILSGFEPCTS